MSEIGYAPDGAFQKVVEHGFDCIEDGEGFEYTVGHIKGGRLKVVFSPDKDVHDCAVIDGVDGFGYTLAYEK